MLKTLFEYYDFNACYTLCLQTVMWAKNDDIVAVIVIS